MKQRESTCVLMTMCARKSTSSTDPLGRTGSRLLCGRCRSQLIMLASAFLTRATGDPPATSPAASVVPRMRAASTRYAKEENGTSTWSKPRSSYSVSVRGDAIFCFGIRL